MTNLDRLRRQTMSSEEASRAAVEMSFLRSDMLKVARMAKTMKIEAILDVQSVRRILRAVGEE